MQKLITTTFSPAMLGPGTIATVQELLNNPDHIRDMTEGFNSAVGHEITAKILTSLLNREVKFRRVNIFLNPGDIVIAIIPGFRSSEAREFTYEEVNKAGFRAFEVRVTQDPDFF